MFDKSGKNITKKHEAQIREHYLNGFLWNPDDWQKLIPKEKLDSILNTKQHLFWEAISQNFAQRIFQNRSSKGLQLIGEPVLIFGPNCLSIGSKDCKLPDPIQEVHKILISTKVDGERDPLNPVTRTIYFQVSKDAIDHPEVLLEIEIPDGLKSPGFEKKLDFRPKINGKRLAKEISILAEVPESPSRTEGRHYPDFNLLFVPYRHLSLEDKSYSSIPDLLLSMKNITKMLFDENDQVVNRLESFLKSKSNYPGFGEGLAGYANYLLGPDGIGTSLRGDGKNILPRFEKISLRIGRNEMTLYNN